MMMFPGYRPDYASLRPQGKCGCQCGCANAAEDLRWGGRWVCGECWAELNAAWPLLIHGPV